MPHAYSAQDGTLLSYRSFGHDEVGTIVLCHGLAAGGMQFDTDAEHFSELGYRVLVPDLRGHGRSAAPPATDTRTYAIATLADDMATMLDHAGAGAVHWVGNSLGGIVALDLVDRQPQRFASLTLFGTAFALNLPSVVTPAIPLLYRVLGPKVLASITAANTTRHKPARPIIAAMTRDFDPKVGAAITDHVRCYDLLAHALAYTGEIMVLVGGRDTAVNLALRPSLQRIGPRPNWTVVELAEGGHCANLDATQNWRAALTAFWADDRARPKPSSPP